MNLERAFVYFASGDERRLTKSGWIRALTDSPFAHCAVGYGHVVLDPHGTGNRLWPLVQYERLYPGLLCRYSLRTPGDPGLDRLPLGVPKPTLPTLARWVAPRIFPDCGWSDCVQTVRHALRHAGVDVPRLITPADLYRWCLSLGAEPKEMKCPEKSKTIALTV